MCAVSPPVVSNTSSRITWLSSCEKPALVTFTWGKNLVGIDREATGSIPPLWTFRKGSDA